MATLTPTLTLASTDAFASQPLSLSVTKALTVTAPMRDVSREAAATGGTVLLTTSEQAAIGYIYVKNTGDLADNSGTATHLMTIADAGGATIATLGAGEFMFLPLAAGEGLKATSATAALWVEYALFSKS